MIRSQILIVRLWLSVLIVGICLVATGGLAQELNPRQLSFPPVAFHPPEPERLVLSNGMVVYLLEDHELPLVTVSATIRTGTWLEPPEKAGLAGVVAVGLRTGGTERMSPAAIDEELDRLAAQLSIVIGAESGVAMLDARRQDLRTGMTILADILRRPAFESSRLELAKLQAMEGVRRRYDQPQSIASREFAKLLYGPDHPLARESSIDSLSRISREDIRAFHAESFYPNRIIIGVTGDFDRNSLVALLRECFEDWPAGTAPSVGLPPPATLPERTVRFVTKGTTQTHLRLGHLSVVEADPDYPALVLLNDILGGGSFRSRLFQDVRTRRGLAYSVSSVLRPGHRAPGVWGVRTETKNDSAQEMIDRVITNVERLRSEPVSEHELAEAKEAFVNSFVFSFASPASIVNRRIQLEYDGLAHDFLQRLREQIMKATKEELLDVARRHLHPERLKILAVGPFQATRALSHFGEAQEIQLKPGG